MDRRPDWKDHFWSNLFSKVMPTEEKLDQWKEGIWSMEGPGRENNAPIVIAILFYKVLILLG